MPTPNQNLRQIGAILLLLVLAYVGSVSWLEWLDQREQVQSDLGTLAELEAQATGAYFDHLKADLGDLASELGNVAPREAERLHGLVQRFHSLHGELYNIGLLGPDGAIVLTAKHPPGTTNATLADEASFIAYRQGLDKGIDFDIGQPFMGRISQVALVPVRQAVRAANGKVAWIISANLPHEHLRSFWMHAPLTRTASIGLILDSGYLISRYPVPPELPVEVLYGQPRTGALTTALRQRGFPVRGSVQGMSSLDREQHVTAFRRLSRHPVTLFVTTSLGSVRAAWWKRVRDGYIATLLLLLSGAFTYRYAQYRQAVSDGEQRLRERILRESEDRYRAILETSPVATAVNDTRRRITYLNAAFERTFGYTLADLPTVAEWQSKAYPDPAYREWVRTTWSERWQSARSAGTAFETMQLQVATKHGAVRTVLASVSPLRLPHGDGFLVTFFDITQRQQLENELRTSEERLQLALTGAAMATWDWNILTGSLIFSSQWAQLQGCQPEELEPTVEGWKARIFPQDFLEIRNRIRSHLSGVAPFYESEHRVQHKDGRWVWLHSVGRVVERAADGQAVRMLGTVSDITDRKTNELKLQEIQRDLLAVQHLAHIGDWSWDLRSGEQEWSSEVYSVFGRSPRDGPCAYPDVRQYFAPESWRVLAAAIEQCLANGQRYECDAEVVRVDGSRRWIAVFGEAVRDASGASARLRGTIQDITERKQMEAQVRQLAFYDPLTKLANRRLLNDRLALAVASCKRTGCHGAVLFLDLDNFKPLNDAHGHKVGDLLLVAAADRLRHCVREIDTVARFGGDEFVVMLSELTRKADQSLVQASQVADKILQQLAQPYRLPLAHDDSPDTVVEHRCTASIGLALFTYRDTRHDDILKWADGAMYEAKAAGRNVVRVHQRLEQGELQ